MSRYWCAVGAIHDNIEINANIYNNMSAIEKRGDPMRRYNEQIIEVQKGNDSGLMISTVISF